MGVGCTPCMDYQTEGLRENPESITNVIIAEKLDTWLTQETVKTCFVGRCVAYWPAVGADVLSAPGAGAQVPLLEPAARATFTHRVGPVTGHLHSPTTDYLLLQWRLQWYNSGDNGAGSRRAAPEWVGGRGRLQNTVYSYCCGLQLHGTEADCKLARRAQFTGVIAGRFCCAFLYRTRFIQPVSIMNGTYF